MAAGLVTLIVLLVCAVLWVTSGERDRFRMAAFAIGGLVVGSSLGTVVVQILGKVLGTAASLFGA